MSELKLKGYVTHSPFGGYRMPVPSQNIILREYCNKNQHIFFLSANEFYLENCYTQLKAVVNSMQDIDGIVMCSAAMLPNCTKERGVILRRILDQGKETHFVFENRVVRTEEDLIELEQLSQLQNICIHPGTLSALKSQTIEAN